MTKTYWVVSGWRPISRCFARKSACRRAYKRLQRTFADCAMVEETRLDQRMEVQ